MGAADYRPPSLQVQRLLAQNRGKDLEEKLEPQFPQESVGIPSFWVYAKPYIGLISLSLLTFLFLIFLLLQRGFKEARLGFFVTLLLGASLAIWLSIEFTIDILGVDTQESDSSLTQPPSTQAASPTSTLEEPEATPSATPTATEPTTIAAIGLTQQAAELDLDLEFPSFWDDLLTAAAGVAAAQEAEESTSNPADNLGDSPGFPTHNGNGGTSDSNPAGAAHLASRLGANATAALGGASPQPGTRDLNLTPLAGRVPGSTLSALPGQNALQPPPSLSRVDFNAPIAFRAVLRQGLTGQDVIVLQKLLQELGFYNTEPDGYFGQQTTSAVQAFQKEHNLLSDGIVGFSTCQILDTQLSAVAIQCRE
ncbi:MAG: peptidoglycan-binding domain-containing protein [Cyanobacteria bacterium P01_G01_bin.54]